MDQSEIIFIGVDLAWSPRNRTGAAVVRGESIEDIAARLDVQLTTVRAQLKAAMEKIGMHRQTDLVRHLGMAMPALLHPQTPTR